MSTDHASRDAYLERVRAAVQFRDRCVQAAMKHHERVDLQPSRHYARATFDAIEELIRADERARLAEAGEP